jgi:hypothetical protein
VQGSEFSQYGKKNQALYPETRCYSARITEVLDPKGLKKGMNKTGHMKGLTQEGNDKIHIESANRLMTNWQNFIFLSKLYTKEEET